MPGFKRLPNRYGTITKLSGKRRKPYCARKYIGEEVDDETHKIKVKYVSVGTFATRKEALEALTAANSDENFGNRITFGKVAEEWKVWRGDVPSSYAPTLKRLTKLYAYDITDLKAKEIEAFINDDAMPRTVRSVLKTELNQIYDYAVRREYVDKNYAKIAKANTDDKPRIERKVFTPEEVRALEQKKHRSVYEDIALVCLYSGMRMSEALGLTAENVDLENHLFVDFGMKTDAGRSRTVPIHDVIFPIISKYALETSKNAPVSLFAALGDKVTNRGYQYYFKTHFEGHTTHDCRHTFASYAFKCGMDDLILKLIMGHSVNDVTKGVYTHITNERLTEEMRKYKIE